MTKMLQPTGPILVGLAFLLLCLFSQSVLAEPTNAIYPESLDKIKDFHNQFTSPSYSSLGQVRSKLPEMAETSRLADEKIFMNGSSQSLEGLISVNGMKSRSVAYDGLLGSTNWQNKCHGHLCHRDNCNSHKHGPRWKRGRNF